MKEGDGRRRKAQEGVRRRKKASEGVRNKLLVRAPHLGVARAGGLVELVAVDLVKGDGPLAVALLVERPPVPRDVQVEQPIAIKVGPHRIVAISVVLV